MKLKRILPYIGVGVLTVGALAYLWFKAPTNEDILRNPILFRKSYINYRESMNIIGEQS